MHTYTVQPPIDLSSAGSKEDSRSAEKDLFLLSALSEVIYDDVGEDGVNSRG